MDTQNDRFKLEDNVMDATQSEPEELELDLIGKVGSKPGREYGIGIVGAGTIVRYGHLPAYNTWGLRVLGVTDVNTDRAEALARDFKLPKVYPNLSALLDDPAVEIVDIAVPAHQQPEIASKALESGRHLLCQKPFAERYSDARRVVELAEARYLKLAVNQQMRWTPAMRAVKELIRRGWLGEPLRAEFDINLWEGLSGWVLEVDPFDLLYYSIHFYDVSRFLYGEPDWVYSICGRWPDQKMRGETRTNVLLEYASGLQLLHRTNHNNHAGDTYATFRVEGTEGAAKGTFGIHYGYPHGRPDGFQFTTKRHMSNCWTEVKFTEKWIPDAFAGPMLSLMEAIDTGSEPATSGRDNLNSLRLAFAIQRSQRLHRPVQPAEVE
jgi:predicted dehydrogenase